MIDKTLKGRVVAPNGEKCHLAKLTWAKVNKIRQMYQSGECSTRQLAKLFNVTQTNIYDIIRYRTWKVHNDK